MKRKIYIYGPDKNENERFIGENFSEEYSAFPEMFVCSTDKQDIDSEAICTYVIYKNEDDWLYHYSGSNKVVLVSSF